MSPSDSNKLPPLEFLAVRPFRVTDKGVVYDANGAYVLVCCDEMDHGCDLFYSGPAVDADPHFICPRCGRLGQRMDDAKASNLSPEEPV